MTSPNDVIERLEAGLTELVNQLRGSIDESTPPRLVEWLTLDAQRTEALLPIVAEAASLIKTLREERDAFETALNEIINYRANKTPYWPTLEMYLAAYNECVKIAEFAIIRARSTQDAP